MSLRSLLDSLHPRNLASDILKSWLDSQIGEAGTVEKIELSFRDKRLTAVLCLQGETDPITVTAHGFRILADGTVTVQRVESTKPWLGILMKKMADDGVFTIPERHLDKLKYITPLLG